MSSNRHGQCLYAVWVVSHNLHVSLPDALNLAFGSVETAGIQKMIKIQSNPSKFTEIHLKDHTVRHAPNWAYLSAFSGQTLWAFYNVIQFSSKILANQIRKAHSEISATMHGKGGMWSEMCHFRIPRPRYSNSEFAWQVRASSGRHRSVIFSHCHTELSASFNFCFV